MAANDFAIFNVKNRIWTQKVPLSSCFMHKSRKKEKSDALPMRYEDSSVISAWH